MILVQHIISHFVRKFSSEKKNNNNNNYSYINHQFCRILFIRITRTLVSIYAFAFTSMTHRCRRPLHLKAPTTAIHPMYSSAINVIVDIYDDNRHSSYSLLDPRGYRPPSYILSTTSYLIAAYPFWITTYTNNQVGCPIVVNVYSSRISNLRYRRRRRS